MTASSFPESPGQDRSAGLTFTSGDVAFLVWGAGVLACLWHPIAGLILLRRLRRRSATDSRLVKIARAALAESARRMKLRRLPALVVGERGAIPSTWGWLRPVILLPADAVESPADRLRVVLLHELAHIKRLDWVTQSLAVVARAFHWPNPLVWWTNRRMRVEQERAADDLVVAAGIRPAFYAETLLAMARARRFAGRSLGIGAVRHGTLEGRLLALMDLSRNRRPLRRRWWVLGWLLFLLSVPPLATVQLVGRPAEVRAPAGQAAGRNPVWGRIHERLTTFDELLPTSVLDLDTGEFVGSGAAGADSVSPGADLKAAAGESDLRARWAIGMATVQAPAEVWSWPPQRALRRLIGRPSVNRVRLTPGDGGGHWLFRTSEGNAGIMSLQPQRGASDRVVVRWKLASGPTPSQDSRLQFRLVSDDPRESADLMEVPGEGGRPIQVVRSVLLDEQGVAEAEAETDPAGRWMVSLRLTPYGASRFAGLTRRNIDRQLAVVFDGRLLSAPVIRSPITGGRAMISGSFSEEQARTIAAALNRGSAKPLSEGAAPAPPMINVAADGSRDYRKIQDALDAAPDGARILVHPGDYAEHLLITKAVTLAGADWHLVTLRPPRGSAKSRKQLEEEVASRLRLATSEAERREVRARFREELGRSVLTIRDTTSVAITGIKLTGLTDGSASPAPAVISLRRAKVYFHGVAVLGGGGDGIQAVDGAELTMRDCLVAAVWGTGVQLGERSLPPVSAVIAASEIRNCRYAGLRISAGGPRVTVNGCRISGAAWHGIRYDDADPHIHGNYIFGNARSGIYASGRTQARVEQNVFHRNEMDGISCWFEDADLIRNNTFAGNLREAVAVLGSSRPRISMNIFAGEKIALVHGRIGSQRSTATNLVALKLERNLFWNCSTNLVEANPAKPHAAPERTQLPETGNLFTDPGFVDSAAGDFGLSAGSPAAVAGLGANQAVPFATRFPLQPEELAIIPETDTRDSRAWRDPYNRE